MADTPQTLEGWVPQLATPSELFDALEQAFDYRGDITVTTKDQTLIEGYLFDRRTGQGLDDSVVRIMPKDGSDTITLPYDQIARLQFADRNPASGKSWENWVARYIESKTKGESANIYSDPLED